MNDTSQPYVKTLRPLSRVEVRRLRALHRRYDHLCKVLRDWVGPITSASFTQAELVALEWVLKELDPRFQPNTLPASPDHDLY